MVPLVIGLMSQFSDKEGKDSFELDVMEDMKNEEIGEEEEKNKKGGNEIDLIENNQIDENNQTIENDFDIENSIVSSLSQDHIRYEKALLLGVAYS